MKTVHAPDAYIPEHPLVFLAGSIEMGEAEPWQERVEEAFQDLPGTLLNPRRGTFLDGGRAHDAAFREQVEWELSGQEGADLILMYFDPNTKSPISLLELGLFHTKKILVCCPDGFWRKGNVEIVCERYGIPLFETLEELIEAGKREFGVDGLENKNF